MDEVFEVDFKLFITWEVPELVGKKDADVVFSKVPNPDIQVMNAHQLQETYREIKLSDSKRGAVKLTQYFRGTLYVELALQVFPFDVQDLQIVLRPHKKSRDKARLSFADDMTAVDQHASTPVLVGIRGVPSPCEKN